MFVEVNSGSVKYRLAVKASQIINIIIITPTREIREPIEEIVFQSV